MEILIGIIGGVFATAIIIILIMCKSALDSTRCGYCKGPVEPAGYYGEMRCLQRCQWTRFEEKNK